MPEEWKNPPRHLGGYAVLVFWLMAARGAAHRGLEPLTRKEAWKHWSELSFESLNPCKHGLGLMSPGKVVADHLGFLNAAL